MVWRHGKAGTASVLSAPEWSGLKGALAGPCAAVVLSSLCRLLEAVHRVDYWAAIGSWRVLIFGGLRAVCAAERDLPHTWGWVSRPAALGKRGAREPRLNALLFLCPCVSTQHHRAPVCVCAVDATVANRHSEMAQNRI